MSWIRATYRVWASAEEVAAVARQIAVEQTVEVPDALIDETIEAEFVADVTAVHRTPEGNASDVVLDYRSELACGHLNQLINLVFGNVSLRSDTRLIDLELPADVLSQFPGPNYGVAGLRELLTAHDRPLLATALKPRGRSNAEFAAMAGEFAAAGGDLVKDDHNLVDRDLASFRDRVVRCQEAVTNANERSGNRALYIPHLMARADQLDAAAAIVQDAGVRGVMVAPYLLGLDWVRAFAVRSGLLILAHPTFTGSLFAGSRHGIQKSLALGTLLRLAGVDVSVFTNHGGRFQFTRAECLDLAERLRAPLGSLAPAWPSPAGGMTLDRMGDLVRDYGNDSVMLIGGALLTHGTSIYDATRAFRAVLDR